MSDGVSLVIYGSRDADVSMSKMDDFVSQILMARPKPKDRFSYYRFEDITEIVCGMCRGADMLGLKYAACLNVPVRKMPADWDRHGKAAGYIRNREMASVATHGLGFWKDESRGTAHMTSLLVSMGKPVVLLTEW